ncbi:fimbrial protein [Serratia proteamaculans]|uniref:fimbrial protein n=1 Tax=Serratia proteamaculans TaxID=28151 RepID=UPI000D9BD7BD|nr:fimbrial protein [Serratia proteamaculans]CAI1095381.1 PAP fimbrial minor pilin protein precursor [Serratia proteamaculans]CAI1130361.1 PAP fimbrial minor pilin protein precursor [Serratia proteamaculans]SPZ57081.1 PAP fimbrial minor pilin protein precursor [Serratia quinivorans]
MNLFIHLLVPPCILISCFISAVPQVAAKAQGGGRVNMQGAIIDTACAIAAGSREQTIDMDAVPVGNIARDGQGNTRPFTIELTNCTLERPTPNLPDWKQFQVTFDGDVDGDLFGVSGEAKGVGLKIIDSQGNVAIPGSPLPFNEIITTRMLLNYTIKLVSNNKPLHAGRYFSSVRFKLDYY